MHPHRGPLLLVVAVSLALGGCVSRSQYLELEQRYEAQSGELVQARQASQILEEQLARIKARTRREVEDLLALIKDFQPLVDRGLIEIKIQRGKITLDMAADVLFPSGSASLSDEGAAAVQEITDLLARRRNREFQVQGHTDTDPITTAQFPDNWYLGAARAITVVEFMIDHGMADSQISAASFGDRQPVAPNDSEAAKAANRRIEIVLVPDLSDLPGTQALLKAFNEQGSPNRGRNHGPPPGREGRGKGGR